MDINNYKKSGTNIISVTDSLKAPLLKINITCSEATVIPASTDLIIYIDTTETESEDRQTYIYSLSSALNYKDGVSDEFVIEPKIDGTNLSIHTYVKRKIESGALLDEEILEEIDNQAIILNKGTNYISTNYTDAEIEMIYPQDNEEMLYFVNTVLYAINSENQVLSLNDIFFKDCFTEIEGNINEEINKLTLKCLTSSNGNFSLDCDGNLVVNSITTKSSSDNTNIDFDSIYPVGSIYLSINSTNPSTLFGGTWEQITDRFLLGAGSTYSSGSTGGSATVTLTTSNLPSHTHSIPSLSGTAASAGAHTHTGRYSKYGTSSGAYYVVRRISSDDAYLGTDTVTNSAGAHTHSVTTNASTTGSNGSGSSHENMPPYIAIYIWKRTA